MEVDLLNIELTVAEAIMHDNASLSLKAPNPSWPDRQLNPEIDSEAAVLLAPDGNGEVSLYAQMATLGLAGRRQQQQPQLQLEQGNTAQRGAGKGHGITVDQASLAGMGAQFDTKVDGK